MKLLLIVGQRRRALMLQPDGSTVEDALAQCAQAGIKDPIAYDSIDLGPVDQTMAAFVGILTPYMAGPLRAAGIVEPDQPNTLEDIVSRVCDVPGVGGVALWEDRPGHYLGALIDRFTPVAGSSTWQAETSLLDVADSLDRAAATLRRQHADQAA